MEIIWRSIGQETLQMAEAQPTLIKYNENVLQISKYHWKFVK